MDIHKAYKFRFYPTPEQEDLLARTFGCVRKVYNDSLEIRRKAYEAHKENVSCTDLDFLLTLRKNQEDYAYLNEVSSVPLQQSLRNLDKAYSSFFKQGKGYPRFKSRYDNQSARYTKSAFSYDGKYTIKLAKMSTKLKIRWSRTIPLGAKVTSVTVSKDKANRYFISFACEDTIAQLPKTENKVGIDLGIKDFAVLSTGEKIEHPKYYRTSEKRLVKCQRELSKKQKGSKNREKARVKVAKAYAKVTDQRKDFLHKLSSRLVSENQVICIEDLAVKNMVKNRHLSKSISDSGWGEFKRQLEYKSVWHGRTLVKVGRFFPSSKTCSTCGCIKDHLDLSERNWTCQYCGTEHDRDVNAALNVLAEGTSVIARGEESSGSLVVGPVSETVLCEAGIPVL